jgi:MYXO-CTERM domain-containing protein
MKKSIIALLLGTVVSVGHAAPVTYEFVYQGLNLSVDGRPYETKWQPDAKIAGGFVAEDKNGDNIITIGELASLHLESDLVTFTFDKTAVNSSAFSSLSFSYDIGDIPHIELRNYWFYPNGYVAGGNGIIVSSMDAGFYIWSSEPTSQSYFSTDQTTFTVTSSVPEPSSAAMGLAGLALLGFVSRRRKAS